MIAPVPPDTEHSTWKLVAALKAVPDPGGVSAAMIKRAEDGYYHDYLSPLALPEMALVAELWALANHPSRSKTQARRALLMIRSRVIGGEFDATRAESDAWSKTPEGRAAFAALVGGKLRPR